MSEENQLPTSPSASPSSLSTPEKAVGDLEGVSDVPERPSPVSVLEPLFVDDNMSPMHDMSLPGRHQELGVYPCILCFVFIYFSSK